jgi:hypothetical protein
MSVDFWALELGKCTVDNRWFGHGAYLSLNSIQLILSPSYLEYQSVAIEQRVVSIAPLQRAIYKQFHQATIEERIHDRVKGSV